VPLRTLIRSVLVPAVGDDAVLRPKSQVVLLLFGDVISGLSFDAVSLTLLNNGDVVQEPALISDEGLRN
jgi:hypothetical protein